MVEKYEIKKYKMKVKLQNRTNIIFMIKWLTWVCNDKTNFESYIIISFRSYKYILSPGVRFLKKLTTVRRRKPIRLKWSYV